MAPRCRWRNASHRSRRCRGGGSRRGNRARSSDLVGLVRRAACAPEPATDLSHGTAVAALITAHADDGLGLAPLATGLLVLDVPVFSRTNDGIAADAVAIAEGIRCAQAEGVSVINLSIASTCAGLEEVERAIASAVAAGISVVSAAGNHGGSGRVCPAAFTDVVGVAASDSAGNVVTSTASAQIAAPGVNVLTAASGMNRSQTLVTGSSFAAPQVSAALAVLADRRPEWTPERRAAHLLAAASTDNATGALVLDFSRLASDLPGFITLDEQGRLGAVGDAVVPSGPAVSGLQAGAATCNGTIAATSAGVVHTFGDAMWLGDLALLDLAGEIVAIEATASGNGYWMAGSDGGVFAFGDASFLGSMGGIALAAEIVELVATETGRGYWLFASDGAVFAFGDALYRGGLRGRINGAIAWDGGYGLLLDTGLVTFPRLQFVPSPLGSPAVDVLAVNGEIFFLNGDGAIASGDGATTVGGPRLGALVRANKTLSCSNGRLDSPN